jgi:tetratricopeptide (TPR) repeat protein
VAHTNLGNALTDLRRFDEAIVQYQKALELRPDYADVHYNLGNVLAARGRLDEAMAHYQKAVELKPAHALAHANFGSVLANQGQFEEAMAHYRRVLELKPGHPDAHNNLARLRATCPEPARRNGDEAVALAKRASQLCGGRRPDYIETLAAAYAEAGRFPDALETARKALALAQQQNKQALADALRAQIAQYEAGKPYHEPLLAPARQPPKP